VPRPKSPDPKTDALRSVGALNPHRGRQRRDLRPAATSSTAATSCRFATKWYGVCATDGRPIARDSNALRRVRPTD